MAKRPYDDLETDYLEEENESGFLSLVSVVIAFIAVAVFIALAWYAYQSSTKSGAQEEIQVVYPEDGPVREAPEETGGWQFPHQDKSVYNIVSGEEKEGEAKVEQILPAPEQPIKRPDVETKTWMNDNLKQDKIAKTDAERLKEAKEQVEVETAPVAEEAVAEETVAEETVAAEPAPAPAITPAVKAETPVVEQKAEPAEKAPEAAPKVVETKPQPPLKAPVKVEAQAVPKPQVKADVKTASGPAKLQLGAVKSEADARAQWQKIKAKHPVLASKSLQVESVSIPGKGTLYRIQAAGFASKAEAKAACSNISAAGQACFAVGK